MNKIFLIGFMGAGKTTVGRVLAQNLDYDFVEVDTVENWEKRGFPQGSLELYRKDKEKYYDIETDILKNFCMKIHRNCVVSTGSSIVNREENIDIMKSNGTIVYLMSSVKILFDRIMNRGHNITNISRWLVNVEATKKMIDSGESKYKIADLYIDTNDKSIEEVCLDIIGKINNND